MSGKISVVVPVYNVGRYVEKTIQSLLQQDYAAFEILLIDDGSTDDSGRICDRYAAKDARVKVTHQKNQGVSIARNVGIQKATGAFVSFVDADDYVSTCYLSSLYAELDERKADAAVQMYANCFPNGKQTRSVAEDVNTLMTGMDFVAFEIVGRRDTSSCGKLFRRDLLVQYGVRFSEYITNLEDMLFLFDYMKHCQRVSYTSTVHYFRLAREDGVTFSAFHPSKLTALQTYDYIIEELEQMGRVDLIPGMIRNKFDSSVFFLLEIGSNDPKLYDKVFRETKVLMKEHRECMGKKEHVKYHLITYLPSLYRMAYRLKMHGRVL